MVSRKMLSSTFIVLLSIIFTLFFAESSFAQTYTLKDGIYMVGVDIPEGNYIVSSHKDNPYFCYVGVFNDLDENGKNNIGEDIAHFSVTHPDNSFFDETQHISEYRLKLKNGQSIEIFMGKALFTSNENAVDVEELIKVDLNSFSLEELKTLEQKIKELIYKKESYGRNGNEEKIVYGKLNYAQVARIPENFEGKKVEFKGTVLQVQGARADGYDIAIATNDNGHDDVIYLYAPPESLSNMNILNGDRLEVKATLQGDHTYNTVLGNIITLPFAYADKVSIIIYESDN